MNDKKAVTTPEAAQYLEVTPPHIRLLYYKGVLKGEKRGRDIWIFVESLEEYKNNRRPPGRPEGTISAGLSKNKRGEREREYQREYKRKLRKGERIGQGTVTSRADKKKPGSKKD